MISEHVNFRHSDKKPVKMTKFDEVANLTKSDRHEFTMFAVSLCNSYASYCISFDSIYRKTVFVRELLTKTNAAPIRSLSIRR